MKNLVKQLKKVAALNAILVVLMAALVLTGWQFELQAIRNIFPNFQLPNPVTALVLLLSVLSFFFVISHKEHLRITGRLLGVLISITGIIKITEYAFHYSSGIDKWLFAEKLLRLGVFGKSNFIAPNTAVNFFLLGCSLFLYTNTPKRKNLLADFFSLATAIIAFISMIGYLYGAPEFYVIASYIPMAFPTALSFFLISTAILLSRSEFGFLRVFTGAYQGNKMARDVLPFVVAIPIITGLLKLHGERAGLFSTGFAVALFVTVNILLFLFLIWRSIISLNRSAKALENEIVHAQFMEQRIREREKFLDILIENIPLVIFVKAARDLRFIKINKAAAEIMGVSRKQLIGKTASDFFSKEKADFFTDKKDREALKKNQMIDIPEESVNANGVYRWLHTQKIPVFNSTGLPEYIISISQDITERKKDNDQLKEFNKQLEEKVKERSQELYRSEKRFRTLIENTKDIIYLRDRTGKLLYMSPAFEKSTGFGARDLKNSDFFSFIYAEDRPKIAEIFQEALNNPGISFFSTLRMQHKNGSYLWIEGTTTNWLDDENINAIVSNYHDITERRKREEEKNRLENTIVQEKINRQKHLMIATIEGQEKEKIQLGMELHDNVNQVLASTKLYLEMAMTDDFDQKQMISKSIYYVNYAIEEIRKLSKELVPHNIKNGGIVESIEEMIQNIEASANLKVNADIGEDVLNTLSNQQQISIYRILQEQINNTLKYAEATSITLKICRQNDCINVCIADNGKGFNMSTKRKGIGLSNIETRAQALGGKCEIFSVPGKGCKLQVIFPAA